MLKRFFVVAALGLSSVACGNECDDAADKAEECFGSSGDAEGEAEEVECSGAIECAAKCMNEASCDDIKAALSGTENSYTKCITACG